jgi:hypothetical protein
MGYYFLTNDYFHNESSTRTTLVWVGDYAAEKALSLVSVLEQFSSIDHHFILFDRNELLSKHIHFKGKSTILSEEYPLWEDDYSLATLLEAIGKMQLEDILPADATKIMIGDSTELIVQAFIRSLFLNTVSTASASPRAKQLAESMSLMLINEEVLFSDLQKEVEEIDRLIQGKFKVNAQIPSNEFEWVSYLNALERTNAALVKSTKMSFAYLFNKKMRDE